MCRGLDPETTPVENVMTREPFTLRTDEPLTDAMSLMEVGGYRHVLIVDDAGDLKGVVTARQILNYIVGFVPDEAKVLPPVSRSAAPRERFGP